MNKLIGFKWGLAFTSNESDKINSDLSRVLVVIFTLRYNKWKITFGRQIVMCKLAHGIESSSHVN